MSTTRTAGRDQVGRALSLAAGAAGSCLLAALTPHLWVQIPALITALVAAGSAYRAITKE